MPQLRMKMPCYIGDYIEPFVGGGSSFLNTTSKRYLLNDIDPYVVRLHLELGKYVDDIDGLYKKYLRLSMVTACLVHLRVELHVKN